MISFRMLICLWADFFAEDEPLPYLTIGLLKQAQTTTPNKTSIHELFRPVFIGHQNQKLKRSWLKSDLSLF